MTQDTPIFRKSPMVGDFVTFTAVKANDGKDGAWQEINEVRQAWLVLVTKGFALLIGESGTLYTAAYPSSMTRVTNPSKERHYVSAISTDKPDTINLVCPHTGEILAEVPLT